MSTLIDKKMDIAASLWIEPCTFEELCRRFKVAQYGFHTLVNSALRDGWIYEKKDETLHCYKKTVKKILNKRGYELDLKEPLPKSDFLKAVEKAIQEGKFFVG